MQDALDDDSETFADLINPGDFNLSDLGQDLPPPPPELLKPSKSPGAKYLSQENLPPARSEELLEKRIGFETMPRSTAANKQNSFMRRSSSVPCKTSEKNRGSTSSSDSGFSPGFC